MDELMKITAPEFEVNRSTMLRDVGWLMGNTEKGESYLILKWHTKEEAKKMLALIESLVTDNDYWWEE